MLDARGHEPTPLHDVATIETPEQIEIALPIAGIGTRAHAYAIDLLFQAIPIVVVFALVVAVYAAGGMASDDDDYFVVGADGQPRLGLLALAVSSFSLFVVNFGYFAFFETIWKGQTPGKRAVGLRVVRDGGHPIDGRAALVRNLLRVIDVLPTFYVAGIATLFAGRSGKRIGDFAAGTFVVLERVQQAPAGPAEMKEAGPLSGDDVALFVGFLERRHELDDGARDRLARTIADRIASRLERPPPFDPEAFLEECFRERRR